MANTNKNNSPSPHFKVRGKRSVEKARRLPLQLNPYEAARRECEEHEVYKSLKGLFEMEAAPPKKKARLGSKENPIVID